MMSFIWHLDFNLSQSKSSNFTLIQYIIAVSLHLWVLREAWYVVSLLILCNCQQQIGNNNKACGSALTFRQKGQSEIWCLR